MVSSCKYSELNALSFFPESELYNLRACGILEIRSRDITLGVRSKKSERITPYTIVFLSPKK